MKYLLTALLIAFISTLNGCSNEETNSSVITKAEAVSVMDDFFTALSTADTSLMISLTHDDMIMYEHVEVWNRDSLLSLMPLTKGRAWEVQELKIESAGNISHVYYFNQGRIPSDRSWLESALLVRDESAVKIKFMHSTKLYLNN